MSVSPKTIQEEELAYNAFQKMEQNSITQLVVVDEDKKIQGNGSYPRYIERRGSIMIMNKRIVLLVVLLLLGQCMWAQSTWVKGKVTDAKTGEVLPLVNVFFTGRLLE